MEINSQLPIFRAPSSAPSRRTQESNPLNEQTESVTLTGTGFAAPVVAARAALVLQQNPEATPAQIKAELTRESGLLTSATGSLVQLTSHDTPQVEHSSLDSFLTRLSGTRPVAVITAQDVNWDQGAEVVSNAQKFVIPVPQFEGEPLVYPNGAKDKDGKCIAGNPIVDWQGQPIGEKGVVFFNPKDQAWQAVKSDGQGVVIMNQITEPQGQKLMGKIKDLTGGDPGKLSLEQFKEVLSFASSEIGWEKPDMYNSDRAFIQKKMNALESTATGIPQFGLFRRDDRDVCKALLAEGPAEFQAPTSGGVMVNQPIGEEGGVLLRQPDGKAFLYRKVDIEAMQETYTHKDGRKLSVSDLPKYEPKA